MGIAPTRADQRLLVCDTCETQATHTPHALRGQRDPAAMPSSFAYVDTGSARHAINTQECDRTSPSNAQPIAPDTVRWAKQRQAHSHSHTPKHPGHIPMSAKTAQIQRSPPTPFGPVWHAPCRTLRRTLYLLAMAVSEMTAEMAVATLQMMNACIMDRANGTPQKRHIPKAMMALFWP